MPRMKLGLRNCELGAVDAAVVELRVAALASCLAALRADAAISR